MNNIHKSWKERLEKEFKEAEGILLQLTKRHQESKGIEIYPAFSDVFRVYQMPLDEVKVLILGEEPYSDNDWSNGLAWGNKQPFGMPKELEIIRRVVENDCYNGLMLDFDDTLNSWWKQGVFLLNRILTVEKDRKLKDKHVQWLNLTNKTIEIISEYNKDVYFMPSIFSNSSIFPIAKTININVFSETNEYLKAINKKEIKW